MLHHTDCAKKICFKLPPYLFKSALFHCASQTIARVVDEHVYLAKALNGRCNGCGNT